MKAFMFWLLLVFYSGPCGSEPLRLDAGNFELAVQTYRHLAVLFYDQSPGSARLIRKWAEASNVARSQDSTVGFATIDASQADVDELVETSGIEVPAVRLFRRGIMFDFDLDPHDSAETMALAVLREAQPSVTSVRTLQDLEARMGKDIIVVVGFFDEEDQEEAGDGGQGLPGMGPFQAFQATADTLKGYADFLIADGHELNQVLEVYSRPGVVYLGKGSNIEGAVVYTGEWVEEGLSDWLLGQDVPPFGDLARGDEKADMYANKFFSSSLPKFIAFTDGFECDLLRIQLQHMARVAESHRGAALFAHCVYGNFPEVTDFFRIQESELPALLFWNPESEAQIMSPSPQPLSTPDLEVFVDAVLEGDYVPTSRTEAEPKVQKGPVMKLVGSTFAKVVSQPDKDVLVLVTKPLCSRCLDVATAFELLGRALQAEERVVLAKIDIMLNDLPASIDPVETEPALLWFPASAKPFENDEPKAQLYPRKSYNLADLLLFLNKENSFGKDSLRLATNEQLGALTIDDEMIRSDLEREEVMSLRNYMRKSYGHVILDWLAGDIIFDGHRWHMAALGASILFNLILLVVASLSAASASPSGKRKERGRRRGKSTEEDDEDAGRTKRKGHNNKEE